MCGSSDVAFLRRELRQDLVDIDALDPRCPVAAARACLGGIELLLPITFQRRATSSRSFLHSCSASSSACARSAASSSLSAARVRASSS